VRGAIAGATIGILLAVLLFGSFYFLSNPDPARHYDAEYGVMCYTTPGAISCVKAP
jgi:hypothetical protein